MNSLINGGRAVWGGGGVLPAPFPRLLRLILLELSVIGVKFVQRIKMFFVWEVKFFN